MQPNYPKQAWQYKVQDVPSLPTSNAVMNNQRGLVLLPHKIDPFSWNKILLMIVIIVKYGTFTASILGECHENVNNSLHF